MKSNNKKSEYIEKLKDPRWQKKRLEILNRDDWRCRVCGDPDKPLHVHHIFYVPKREPWDINNGFLITVCENCHKNICECGPCEECPDYSFDKNQPQRCEGPGDTAEELRECIGELLDQVWKINNESTFSACIGITERKIKNIGVNK